MRACEKVQLTLPVIGCQQCAFHRAIPNVLPLSPPKGGSKREYLHLALPFSSSLQIIVDTSNLVCGLDISSPRLAYERQIVPFVTFGKSAIISRKWYEMVQFFRSISSSCISSLIPNLRNHDVTSRLRAASLYPRPVTRTKRYTSFINYSLLRYQ